MIKREQLYVVVVMLVIYLLLPLLMRGDLYLLHVASIGLIWGTVASLWNFVMGYAGIFTFAQTALFVVGAYTSAILVTKLGVSPWVGILGAGIFNSAIGTIIALPCLKLRGVYVALVTFTFYLVLETVIRQGSVLGTGGSKGIWAIPPLQIGPLVLSTENRIIAYYAFMTIGFSILFIIYRLLNSKLGLSFVAVRDSESLAENLGINAYRTRLIAFNLTSILTGFVGAFYVHYIQFISPKTLSLETFLMVMLMLIVGGYGRFPGAFLGAFFVTILSEVLRPVEQFRFLVFGALMILSIIFMRKGLIGLILDSFLPYMNRIIVTHKRKEAVDVNK